MLLFVIVVGELVGVFELGGDHKHDSLGAGRDFDHVGLDLELNWALLLLLVDFGGEPRTTVEQRIRALQGRLAHGL